MVKKGFPMHCLFQLTFQSFIHSHSHSTNIDSTHRSEGQVQDGGISGCWAHPLPRTHWMYIDSERQLWANWTASAQQARERDCTEMIGEPWHLSRNWGNHPGPETLGEWHLFLFPLNVDGQELPSGSLADLQDDVAHPQAPQQIGGHHSMHTRHTSTQKLIQCVSGMLLHKPTGLHAEGTPPPGESAEELTKHCGICLQGYHARESCGHNEALLCAVVILPLLEKMWSQQNAVVPTGKTVPSTESVELLGHWETSMQTHRSRDPRTGYQERQGWVTDENGEGEYS